MENNADKTKEFKRLLTIFLYKYFRFLILIMAMFILLLGNSLVIKPKRVSINHNQEEAIEKRELEKEKLLKYLDDLKKYRLEYEKISVSDREKIKKFLPDSPGKESLFLEIEKICRQVGAGVSGLAIKEMQAAAVQSSRSKSAAKSATGLPDKIGVLGVDLTLADKLDYEVFKKLLKEFESNLRLMDIQSLDYSNESGEVKLSLYTYYINDK